MAEPGRRDVLAHDAYLARRHYPGLDAIRAAAVLIVMTWHVNSCMLHRLLGYRGVQWFFVLSGFLITTLCLAEEERHGRVSLRGFLVRRAHRILPLYAIALAANAVYDLVLVRYGERTDAWASYWPLYLVMMQELPLLLGWTVDYTPFPPAWSLAIEEKFYLVWPPLAFALLRRARVALVVSLMTVVALITLIRPDTVPSRLTSPYFSILIGCGLAMALRNPVTYRWLSARLRWWIVPVAATIAVLIPWDWEVYHGVALVVYPLMIALVLGGMVVSTADDAFEHPWAVWIGQRSYAIYLFHNLVFRSVDQVIEQVAFPERLRGWTVLVVGGAITFVLADVLRRVIEQPMIARGRRLAARTPSPGQSIATT